MLMLILGWVASAIPGIGKIFVDAYSAKLASVNTLDAHTTEMVARELALEQREKEVAASIVIAEQGNWFTRWVRPMWAFPFVVFTWKVVLWDVVLKWGTTDELHGTTATLMVTVAGAYFGGRTIEKVATILKRNK